MSSECRGQSCTSHWAVLLCTRLLIMDLCFHLWKLLFPVLVNKPKRMFIQYEYILMIMKYRNLLLSTKLRIISPTALHVRSIHARPCRLGSQSPHPSLTIRCLYMATSFLAKGTMCCRARANDDTAAKHLSKTRTCLKLVLELQLLWLGFVGPRLLVCERRRRRSRLTNDPRELRQRGEASRL